MTTFGYIVRRPISNPRVRRVPSRLAIDPTEADLQRYEKFAEYIGSGEHKNAPWNGIVPASRREKNANLCPVYITKEQATTMLRAGILAGNISEDFDGDMPRRVWYKGDLGIFEARLTDRADIEAGKSAGYKGWPESSENLPRKPREVRRSDGV